MRLMGIFKVLIIYLCLLLSACGDSGFSVAGSGGNVSQMSKNQNLVFGETVTTPNGWKIRATYPNFFENKSVNSWNITGE